MGEDMAFIESMNQGMQGNRLSMRTVSPNAARTASKASRAVLPLCAL
jgi:hypothetical protein